MRETIPVADEQVATPSSSDHSTGAARLATLIGGDAISFVVFAAVGRHSHHEAAGLAAIGLTVATAAPFAAGWYLVAPWLGAFRRSATNGVRAMLKRTELAWLAAWPVAVLLRWALDPHHEMYVSFAIVILLANAVFLGVWRSLFALILGRRAA